MFGQLRLRPPRFAVTQNTGPATRDQWLEDPAEAARMAASEVLGGTKGELRGEAVMSLDEWAQIFSAFSYNGLMYPFIPFQQTAPGQREEVGAGFVGFVQSAYRSNGVVFSLMLVRMLLFSEARFMFQDMTEGRPGKLYAPPGTSDLDLLAHPWTNAATGDLLTRAIQDVDLAGNFFTLRHVNRDTGNLELRRLRPDWVTIVAGSTTDLDAQGYDLDSRLLGYVYAPGGAGMPGDPNFILPEQICHFAPVPDPFFNFRGMPWLEPILREVMADGGFTSHKLKYLEHGATPNMVVTLDPDIGKDLFNQWIEKFEAKHVGLLNAYRTLYLGGGASAAVVGNNLKDMDYKLVQGAGETRIAAAAGVPPVIAGLSEGLAAATYSNYQQSMRRLGDGTMRPLWRNLSSSLESIINLPPKSRLWYDDRDIPWLREDVKDRAAAQLSQAQVVAALIEAGFEPKSVIAAVTGDDFTLLTHTGLFSTKLQAPGEMGEPGGPIPGIGPPPILMPAIPKKPKTGEELPAGGTAPAAPASTTPTSQPVAPGGNGSKPPVSAGSSGGQP